MEVTIYPLGVEPLAAVKGHGRKNQKRRLGLADRSRLTTGADRFEKEKRTSKEVVGRWGITRSKEAAAPLTGAAR